MIRLSWQSYIFMTLILGAGKSFSDADCPKIEVWRTACSPNPRSTEGVIAQVTDVTSVHSAPHNWPQGRHCTIHYGSVEMIQNCTAIRTGGRQFLAHGRSKRCCPSTAHPVQSVIAVVQPFVEQTLVSILDPSHRLPADIRPANRLRATGRIGERAVDHIHAVGFGDHDMRPDRAIGAFITYQAVVPRISGYPHPCWPSMPRLACRCYANDIGRRR